MTNNPDDRNECEWIIPMKQEDGSRRVALFSHEESTYRRGEVSKKKWCFPGYEPLYQKGRMQSVMQSWFILQHPIGPFFKLTDKEFEKACEKYPSLKETDSFYYQNEASGQIVLDGKNYFDYEKILEQFERLFQLIEFCEAHYDHDIEILVDNATTHTSKSYSINDFRKGSGYNCPVDSIDWYDENDNLKSLNCYYKEEKGVLQSKGLFKITKELGVIEVNCEPKEYKLEALKDILRKHPAFKEETKLEE